MRRVDDASAETSATSIADFFFNFFSIFFFHGTCVIAPQLGARPIHSSTHLKYKRGRRIWCIDVEIPLLLADLTEIDSCEYKR